MVRPPVQPVEASDTVWHNREAVCLSRVVFQEENNTQMAEETNANGRGIRRALECWRVGNRVEFAGDWVS